MVEPRFGGCCTGGGLNNIYGGFASADASGGTSFASANVNGTSKASASLSNDFTTSDSQGAERPSKAAVSVNSPHRDEIISIVNSQVQPDGTVIVSDAPATDSTETATTTDTTTTTTA